MTKIKKASRECILTLERVCTLVRLNKKLTKMAQNFYPFLSGVQLTILVGFNLEKPRFVPLQVVFYLLIVLFFKWAAKDNLANGGYFAIRNCLEKGN